MSDILVLLREEDAETPWTGPDGLFQRAADEIERLRARIVELEAARAVTLGTLEPPCDALSDWSVTHNVPGNAPV